MKTNSIRLGSVVVLSDGRRAVLNDSRTGNIRSVIVDGHRAYVYAFQFTHVLVGGEFKDVELTSRQKVLRDTFIQYGNEIMKGAEDV